MNFESKIKLPNHGIVRSIISLSCLAYLPVFLVNFFDIIGFPFIGWALELMGNQSIQLFVKNLYSNYQLSIDASIIAFCIFITLRYCAFSSWLELFQALQIKGYENTIRPALLTTGFTIVATAFVISIALLLDPNAHLFAFIPLNELIPSLTLNVIIFQLADSVQLSVWYFGGFYRYFRRVVPWYIALIPGGYFTTLSEITENFSIMGLVQYYVPIVAGAWLYEKTGKLGSVVIFLTIWLWLKFFVVAAVHSVLV